MTRGAANAIQTILQRDSRNAAVLTSSTANHMTLTAMDTSSMIVHDATFDAPPAYEEVL